MHRTCSNLHKLNSSFSSLAALLNQNLKSNVYPCELLIQQPFVLNKGNVLKYNCWSCSKALSDTQCRSFFCPCEKKKILPVPIRNTSYFDLFGLKPEYNVDKEALTKNFRQLMRKLHPDLYHQSSEKEQMYSAEQSSLVNKAYRVLLNPIKRGLYMLEINNVNFEKETVETGEFDPDKQELLMNVLELNEKLNDVRSSDQVAEFEAELAGILKPLKRELNAAFVAGDLKQAVNVISKMKYFQNIDERFQELKLELTLTDSKK